MLKIGLHWWILLGVLVGAVAGTLLYSANIDEARLQVLGAGYSDSATVERAGEVGRQVSNDLKSNSIYQAFNGIADIFMHLLKMVVVPLVVFSLLSGIAGIGDIRRLGRIGVKTFGWYIMTSLIAIFTGLFVVNLIKPGVGTTLQMPEGAVAKEIPGSAWEVITNMIPTNVVSAAANFELIGVIFFTLIFGIFILTIGEKKEVIIKFVDAGAQIMMNMTHFVIWLAPVGIAALIARMVSTTGPSVFLSLIMYVVTVFSALGIHFFITLPLLMVIFTRRNPFRYMRAMSAALITAFSTASSSGTLAVTMECVEERAGISNRVAGFVLPLGATINMDGTALYEVVTVLFIAQIHSGLDPTFSLTTGQQVFICFLGLAVSIGAAAIPHAGLVMMVIILEAVGLPVAYTGLIWTVDRVLDMCRTTVNVWSDSSIALVVASSEKEVDEKVLFSP